MKHTCTLVWSLTATLLLLQAEVPAQTPLGTAFTYQGQLKQAGEPVNDTADFEFWLWDAETGGAQVGPLVPVNNWLIEGGLFTVLLDFGEGVFDGEARWLEIAVRSPAGSGEFTTLSPRQPLTATPYALYALSGPGSAGFWAANGDDVYNTNSGNVGVGTSTPAYVLHVVGDGGIPVVYVRSNAPGARALHASSNGTGVYADGGSCGLDAYTDSPTGNAISAFNEAESGNAYAVYAENISPTGIAIYGLANNDDEYSTGIGVYGRSDSDHPGIGVYGETTNFGITYGVRGVSAHGTGVRGEQTDSGNYGTLGNAQYGVKGVTASGDGHGVHGYASAVSGANRGVYGLTDSYDGHGGYFENTASGSYGALGGDAFGVQGRGHTAGGFFEDAGGSTYAYVGHSELGIKAYGADGGGYFEDISASGYAYAGYGDRGIEAEGSEAGGYFEDTDDTGYAYVGCYAYGIKAYGRRDAWGEGGGGYFEDEYYGAHAYVGSGGLGIDAKGGTAGGYFENTNGTSHGYIGYGETGVHAHGNTKGGAFYDTDDSGRAFIAYGDRGVEATGSEAGGYFEDWDGTSSAYIAYGDRGIEAAGDAAGGYFETTSDIVSAYAYVGYGAGYGVHSFGDVAGGYFADADESGYAYVGHSDSGVTAYGNMGGGYFVDADDSAYAWVAQYHYGIKAYGNFAGGYFEDSNSGTWSEVASDASKIVSNGTCDFVQNHPEDPEAVVVYACPEGDEVATYTRGTARLQNGVVHVPLGETFKWVTNPDIGLTAHLTLRGDSPGLYVESLSTEELVVREVGGGTTDIAFDYLVYGLRIGFEEVPVVREKEREAYIPSMASHRALYERRPELRDYNALERFKRMRAAAGQAEPLDLSASEALHDAVVEFDPAIHTIERPEPAQLDNLDDAGDEQASTHVGVLEVAPAAPVDDGLRDILHQKHSRIATQQQEIAALRVRLETLEVLVARLTATPEGGAR
jgi:hypothetical protein